MIAIVGAALAKPPPQPVGPDPAHLAAQEAAACAPETPEGFQISTGHGSGTDSGAAIAAATASARKAAIETACAGKSELRCAVIKRHVEPWKVPFWNPLTGHACAHVGVRREWLDDDRADAADFSADLRTLAGRILEHAKGRKVALRPPLWSATGCAVGTVGAVVEAELKNALAAAGPVVLVQPGTAGAVAIATTLDPRGADVVLAATADDPAAGGAVPLPGFSFPADLFGVAGAGEDCRFDSALGLTNGQRRGTDGRRVTLAVGTSGTYCAGDTARARLVVDRPSDVQVFSVSRTGTALLVWPPPGQSRRVAAEVDLGTFDLFPVPEGGDEKLLAVAVEPGSAMGASSSFTALCELPLVMEASSYPASAALGSATFEVLGLEADECAGRPLVSAPAMPDVPTCK